MKTYIWFQQEDQHRPGQTDFDHQFKVEDPQFIPPMGAFIDSDHSVAGWVTQIQFMYGKHYLSIYITLSEKKPQ